MHWSHHIFGVRPCQELGGGERGGKVDFGARDMQFPRLNGERRGAICGYGGLREEREKGKRLVLFRNLTYVGGGRKEIQRGDHSSD